MDTADGEGDTRSITWNLWGSSPFSIPCKDNTKKQNELWPGRVRCSQTTRLKPSLYPS